MKYYSPQCDEFRIYPYYSSPHQMIFREIIYGITFLQELDLTEFCKTFVVEELQLNTCSGKTRNSVPCRIFFVKLTQSKTVSFTQFLRQNLSSDLNFLQGITKLYIICTTMWKNKKSTITKFLRQINSLVIHLVNPVLSRNFCQKRESNFHTVNAVLSCNCRRSFLQNSVKSTFSLEFSQYCFAKNSVKSLFYSNVVL